MITLKKMDVRFKMASMALLSIVVLKADATGLIFLSILCLALWMSVRFSILALIRHFRYLGFLLLVVFLARALTVSFFPGPAGALISLDPEGAVEGLMICWRLIILTFLGILWMTSSSPSGYPHGCRVVLQTFSRIARKTGGDHDEPDGAIPANDRGTSQGNFSGPAMPMHSESKKSDLPDR